MVFNYCIDFVNDKGIKFFKLDVIIKMKGVIERM